MPFRMSGEEIRALRERGLYREIEGIPAALYEYHNIILPAAGARWDKSQSVRGMRAKKVDNDESIIGALGKKYHPENGWTAIFRVIHVKGQI